MSSNYELPTGIDHLVIDTWDTKHDPQACLDLVEIIPQFSGVTVVLNFKHHGTVQVEAWLNDNEEIEITTKELK